MAAAGRRLPGTGLGVGGGMEQPFSYAKQEPCCLGLSKAMQPSNFHGLFLAYRK